MARRYDPKAAHDRVRYELRMAAIRAYEAGGSRAALTAAFAAADRQAEAAANAERARQTRWQKLRDRVLMDDVCRYCGEGATQVDHMVPFSRGGTDDLDNLVAACASCNMEKLDFTVDEWQAWRVGRGECWPPEGFNARLKRIVDDVIARYGPA